MQRSLFIFSFSDAERDRNVKKNSVVKNRGSYSICGVDKHCALSNRKNCPRKVYWRFHNDCEWVL